MKKYKLTGYTMLICLFALINLLGSCKKDVLSSRDLLVYVPGEYGSVNNTITASLIHTPIAVWGATSFNIPVYTTREVTTDVTVYLTPDSTVASYNAANGTSYSLLPAGAYRIANDSKHTISSGSLMSDPLKIELTDAASLTDTKGYLLPLTVTKVESNDKGVRVSTNQGTVYLAIPYQYTNVDTVQSPLTDPVMSRTGWAVTVSNSSSGTANQASNMLDGSNSTVWRSSNSSTAAKTVTVDMASAQTIRGFRISPDYTNTNENATQMTISTSTDNVTYTVQGVWKGTGPAAGTNATNPDIKGVNFLVPVQARYFRFTVNSWVSGNIVGMAEINAVQ